MTERGERNRTPGYAFGMTVGVGQRAAQFDFDRPSNPPKPDPINEAFGIGIYQPNHQVPGVLDHRGHLHFFKRCYFTTPHHTLVDIYDDTPETSIHDEPVDTEAGRRANSVAEKSRADRIAAQIEAHNTAHPDDKFGLMQMWVDERPDIEDTQITAAGGAVGLRLSDT
jgi:hypothetical protein